MISWSDWDGDGNEHEFLKGLGILAEDLALVVFDADNDGEITMQEVIMKLAALGFAVSKK